MEEPGASCLTIYHIPSAIFQDDVFEISGRNHIRVSESRVSYSFRISTVGSAC